MVEPNTDFMMPNVNFFGPGVISKIGDRAKMLNMKKPLIVTGPFLRQMENGPVKQTEASLKAVLTTHSTTKSNQILRFGTLKQVSKPTTTTIAIALFLLVGDHHTTALRGLVSCSLTVTTSQNSPESKP